MNKRTAILSAVLIGLTAEMAPVKAEAPPPPAMAPDRAQLERRLESVKTLLEKSSAAKQIEASGDATARAERAKALEMWQEAKKAFDAGDLAQTQKLLLEAPKLLFAAARHSAPEEITRDKARADYENRKASVKALMEAQKRVADEKGTAKGAGETAKNVDKLMAEAEQLAAGGQFVKARSVADQAYLLAKASVGEMRSGDTLVRSLNFATKADEYKYEQDRNDSLQMLYKVLIEQKGTATSFVEAQVKKARELRGEAETTAASGNHEKAIKQMEDSTGQLIRAIRSAGIFIPG